MSQIRPGSDAVGMVAEPDDEPRPTAAQRLAAALGWEEVPELNDDELRELDQEFDAAQAEARRFYGLGERE